MAFGFKYQKNTGRSPGAHPYSPQDMIHVVWCMKKGIKIAVIPHWEGASNEWRIELNIKKKIHLDPAVYIADKAYKKMYEYYKYYYDKYRN